MYLFRGRTRNRQRKRWVGQDQVSATTALIAESFSLIALYFQRTTYSWQLNYQLLVYNFETNSKNLEIKLLNFDRSIESLQMSKLAAASGMLSWTSSRF